MRPLASIAVVLVALAGILGLSVTSSLDAALNALEKDHAFLLKGDVFTSEVPFPIARGGGSFC